MNKNERRLSRLEHADVPQDGQRLFFTVPRESPDECLARHGHITVPGATYLFIEATSTDDDR